MYEYYNKRFIARVRKSAAADNKEQKKSFNSVYWTLRGIQYSQIYEAFKWCYCSARRHGLDDSEFGEDDIKDLGGFQRVVPILRVMPVAPPK